MIGYDTLMLCYCEDMKYKITEQLLISTGEKLSFRSPSLKSSFRFSTLKFFESTTFQPLEIQKPPKLPPKKALLPKILLPIDCHCHTFPPPHHQRRRLLSAGKCKVLKMSFNNFFPVFPREAHFSLSVTSHDWSKSSGHFPDSHPLSLLPVPRRLCRYTFFIKLLIFLISSPSPFFLGALLGARLTGILYHYGAKVSGEIFCFC